MSTIIVLAVIDLLGLGGIWLYVRSRLAAALESESLLEGIRKEIRALNIELNEAADRNISLVEDRLEALRKLLEEADRRMGVMKREMDNRAAENYVYSRLGRPQPAEKPASSAASAGDAAMRRTPARTPVQESLPYGELATRGDARSENAASPGPRSDSAPDSGERTGARQNGRRGVEEPIRLDLARRPSEIVTARESVIPPKSRREEAMNLWERGFSADIIAARTGATVAEVDLLISLEEERRQAEDR
jgi:hypothetical protein